MSQNMLAPKICVNRFYEVSTVKTDVGREFGRLSKSSWLSSLLGSGNLRASVFTLTPLGKNINLSEVPCQNSYIPNNI